ncbi:MAG: hypothetical protein M3Q97_07280 [Bacteroidota bacterium]|nr:hypothetical protein [Bacteroidota bacterium]
MKISGFTFGKNVSKLYYPIRPAIESILPIVDEFIVALGAGDADDHTREEIAKINSQKIKIIDTIWDLEKYPNGMENAHQTDIAKKECTGDWLFYLQADEVVHEKDLATIENRCIELLNDKEVEGLLFKYRHFFGDYQHYADTHGWYSHDIRIIRNDPEIHSFESAQSFRRIPGFDGKSYRRKEGSQKLKVVPVDAYIYHYGWVRPPHHMQKKRKALATIHKGEEKVTEMFRGKPPTFDYGPMKLLSEFKGSHPSVMKEWIERFDWGEQLNYADTKLPARELFKHEKMKYRLITWIEKTIMGRRQLFGYANWKLLKK